MDLFELSAKIELDTEDYEKSAKNASDKAKEVEKSLDSTGNASEKAEKSIDDLSQATEKSGKSSKRSASTAKMLSEVLKRLDQIVANTAKESDDTAEAVEEFADSMEKAEDAAEDLGDAAEEASEDADGLGDSVNGTKNSLTGSIVKADLFTKAIEKAGEMALEVAKYVWNLDEATEEYRASQAKLNTAFRVSGFGANTAKVAFQGLYRAVGDIDQATEASQLLSQLALTTEDVAKWTEIATGVVGTFGDSLPIESLIESANETARTGKVVGTLADALNWAGNVGEDEFNAMLAECKTQEEKVNLITETLSETYKGAADTFKETSGSVMDARESLLKIQEASAGAGREIENLKGTLTGKGALTAQGFFVSVEKAASALNGLIKNTKTASDRYEDLLLEYENKIETGSIEDVSTALEELQGIAKSTKGPLNNLFSEKGPMTWLGTFRSMGFEENVTGLIASAKDRIAELSGASELAATQEERLAAASVEVVEEIEPIIATADGVSVALEGTGMTAEEASSRLQTYTSAALNMFERISEESELSYQDAIGNLEANIDATNRFADNMTSIAGSLPPALAEMFRAGGPQMYAGVVAMLAEANAGTDEGLSQLNQLWEQGGEAAVNAFITSLGKIPEDTQDPAKIVAAQMEEDTSMEAAGVSAVDRTASAMSDAVASAGFDNSGAMAMDRFIAGLESRRGAVLSKARDIANAAKQVIDSVLNSVGSGGSGRAGGLDYVPYNGYPATLHAGEAVLTAREAKEWRSGNSGNGKSVVINQYINSVPMTPVELEAAAASYLEQVVWRL